MRLNGMILHQHYFYYERPTTSTIVVACAGLSTGGGGSGWSTMAGSKEHDGHIDFYNNISILKIHDKDHVFFSEV